MAISLKHTFQSAKADGADTTLVQPSNWNAEHTITAAAGKVLGRDTSGAGAVQELPIAVDTSGNVGIGTSSLNDKFTVAGNLARSAARADSTSSEVELEAQASDYWSGPSYTGTAIGQWGGTATGTTMGFPNASLGFLRFQNGSNGLVYTNGNAPLAFGTNSTERMRIDSAGNVGIGTSSVASGYRIESTGSVKLTSDYPVYAGTTANGRGWRMGTTSNGTNLGYFYIQGTTDNWSSSFIDGLFINSTGEVRIASNTDNGVYNLQCNGTGVWGAGAYVNGSDERIKDDINPIGSCLNIVNALNPITFRYKPDFSKDQALQPGFIAQELQTVLADQPYLEGVVQAGPEYLSVAYQTLIPVLTKALQEASAKIDALETRLAALEAA